MIARLIVTGLLLVGSATSVTAQTFSERDCPRLSTIEMTRQRIEALRADREAGIDRLPTAEHRALAHRSLYQWYWPRLAELDRQREQAEEACRVAQLRRDESFTRVAPVPQSNPVPDDPFTRGTQEHPTEPDPFGGPVDRGRYDDPFDGQVDRGGHDDPFSPPEERPAPAPDPSYRQPRVRVYQPPANPRGSGARDPRVPHAPDRREPRRRAR